MAQHTSPTWLVIRVPVVDGRDGEAERLELLADVVFEQIARGDIWRGRCQRAPISGPWGLGNETVFMDADHGDRPRRQGRERGLTAT